MEFINIILLKSLLISLFCVGLRIVSDKGMILHFLRSPYDALLDRKELYERMLSDGMIKPEKVNEAFAKLKITSYYIYILKPVIGCITCMSSVWTIVAEMFYFGGISKWTIIVIFAVAAINTIIYNIIQKLQS